ncbi:MAG: choice-of-anchor L domain-containing protein, partial [Bacteroidota bacterium]
MNATQRFLFLVLFAPLSFSFLDAQLVLTPVSNPASLSNFLAGQGVTISNVSMNCPQNSAGTFDGTNSNIGIGNGLVLSTGAVNDLNGPNGSGNTSGDMSAMGDTDFDALTGFQTFDACVLEFDAVPSANNIQFNYVFGSEEYPEFVNSNFNDGFAIWISGPGITGNQNVAYLPNSATTVTVDNVNSGNNSQHFVNNGDGTVAPQNTDSTVVQLDGFTVNITVSVAVQANQSYHFKIGVADAGD